MPQPKKAPRFGGSPGHHNLLVSNLTTELFRHGRISTTLAKAKTVQPLADRMVTFAKRGDVHARRQVLRVIRDKDVVHKLFADIGPAFVERNGGYTRVLKTGPRKGDAAPMAIIELVEGVSVTGDGDLAEEPRRRWSLRRRAGTLSASARDREEDRASAVDRGEDFEPQVDPESSGEAAEAVPVGTLPKTERPEPADTGAAEEPQDAEERQDAAEAEATDESDGPEASAAEVEARLAAEESVQEQAAAAESAEADEAQADAPRADGDPRS